MGIVVPRYLALARIGVQIAASNMEFQRMLKGQRRLGRGPIQALERQPWSWKGLDMIGKLCRLLLLLLQQILGPTKLGEIQAMEAKGKGTGQLPERIGHLIWE